MTPKHIVAVSGLVTNAAGEVLLVRSPRRGWEVPGGQVEEGETLPEALRREIMEEAGVTVTVGKLVGIYTNIKLPPKVIFGFRCAWVSGELTTSPESVETAWFPPDAALPRVTHPAIDQRLRDMLAFTGTVVYRVYTTDPYQILDATVL
ncbi:MAG: NUDIX hydrolase [Anaerolineaceae bacterium]|nr:NUDIX hydrolase [Anaerolineaceae bacterium]